MSDSHPAPREERPPLTTALPPDLRAGLTLHFGLNPTDVAVFTARTRRYPTADLASTTGALSGWNAWSEPVGLDGNDATTVHYTIPVGSYAEGLQIVDHATGVRGRSILVPIADGVDRPSPVCAAITDGGDYSQDVAELTLADHGLAGLWVGPAPEERPQVGRRAYTLGDLASVERMRVDASEYDVVGFGPVGLTRRDSGIDLEVTARLDVRSVLPPDAPTAGVDLSRYLTAHREQILQFVAATWGDGPDEIDTVDWPVLHVTHTVAGLAPDIPLSHIPDLLREHTSVDDWDTAISPRALGLYIETSTPARPLGVLEFESPAVGTPMDTPARGRHLLASYNQTWGAGQPPATVAASLLADLAAHVEHTATTEDDPDVLDTPSASEWLDTALSAHTMELHELRTVTVPDLPGCRYRVDPALVVNPDGDAVPPAAARGAAVVAAYIRAGYSSGNDEVQAIARDVAQDVLRHLHNHGHDADNLINDAALLPAVAHSPRSAVPETSARRGVVSPVAASTVSDGSFEAWLAGEGPVEPQTPDLDELADRLTAALVNGHARALAEAVVYLGANSEWDSSAVEILAEPIQRAALDAGLPEFGSTGLDDVNHTFYGRIALAVGMKTNYEPEADLDETETVSTGDPASTAQSPTHPGTSQTPIPGQIGADATADPGAPMPDLTFPV